LIPRILANTPTAIISVVLTRPYMALLARLLHPSYDRGTHVFITAPFPISRHTAVKEHWFHATRKSTCSNGRRSPARHRRARHCRARHRYARHRRGGGQCVSVILAIPPTAIIRAVLTRPYSAPAARPLRPSRDRDIHVFTAPFPILRHTAVKGHWSLATRKSTCSHQGSHVRWSPARHGCGGGSFPDDGVR